MSSVIVPYASYLRVYEPLAAFPEPERATGRVTPAARPPHLPGRTAPLAGRPAAHPAGRRCRCTRAPTRSSPRSTGCCASAPGAPGCAAGRRWASWARNCPRPVLDAVLPPLVRHQAAQDYERWLTRNPDARPWIRTATWQVPLNWFVLVSDEEREYEAGGGPRRATAPVLRYRTPMVQARRRVARGPADAAGRPRRGAAHRRAGGRGALAGGVPSALAGGAGLRRPGARPARRRSSTATTRRRTWPRGSRRCARVTGTRPGEAYGRLVERWRAVRDRRSAN